MEPGSRGDPESPLRWTTKSTRRLQGELSAAGHRASVPTVAKLLKAEGFSLQANTKTIEGAQHPDRDAQFRYLNDQARDHIAAADPVMVDRESRQINRDRTLLTNAVVAHGDNEYADSTSNPPYSNTSYSRSAATG